MPDSREDNLIRQFKIESLRKGVIPDASILATLAKGKIPAENQPFFQYQPVSRGNTASGKLMTEQAAQIYADISHLYDEIKRLNRIIETVENHYRTEENRINTTIRIMEDQVSMLREYTTGIPVIGDTFWNLNNVDTLNTTAFVDLRSGEVKLIPTNLDSGTIDLSTASIEVVTDDPKDIISVTGQDVFMQGKGSLIISVQSRNRTTQVTVKVRFGSLHKINYGTLSLDSPGRTSCRLIMGQYKTNTKNTLPNLRWDFDSIETNTVLIEIRRSTEKKNTQDLYVHALAIREMSFGLLTYSASEVLVTKAVQIAPEISRFKVQVTDEQPPGTSIGYFYSCVPPGESDRWTAFQPGETVYLGDVQHISQQIYPDSSMVDPLYGEIFVDPSTSKLLYTVSSLRPDYILRSVKLMAGESMWLIEKHTGTISQASEFFADPFSLPTYVAMNDPKYIKLEGGNTYRISAFGRTAARVVRRITPVAMTSTVEVYANGKKLHPIQEPSSGVNHYDITFEPGWNFVSFVVSAPQTDYFYPGIHLGEVCTEVYAHRAPLKYATPYEIATKVSAYAYDRFTIVDGKVLVPYNVRAVEVNGNGVRYTLEYDTFTPTVTRELKFMFRISRSQDPTVTPKISKYTVEVM